MFHFMECDGMTYRGAAFVSVLASVAALQIGCLNPVAASKSSDTPGAVGFWVLHVEGGPLVNHVQLFSIWREPSDSTDSLWIQPLPSRSWSGAPSMDFASGVAVGRNIGGTYVWGVRLADGNPATLQFRVAADTARGLLRGSRTGGLSDSLPVVGVRVPGYMFGAAPSSIRSLSRSDSTAVVLLQIDDLAPTDPAFIERLEARGLYAQLSVPSQLVGIDGRPTWTQVREWADTGFGIAAHSRVHRNMSPDSTAEFMGEVLGSLEDLANQGLPTGVFVQPGAWKDSLDFTTPRALQNWRGALFHTFVRVLEAYVYPVPQPFPLPDSVAYGLGHVTISPGDGNGNVSNAYILDEWMRAQRPRRFTVFMLHTRDLPSPGSLDWFLDTLADARRDGRIRLAHDAGDGIP